MRAVQAARNAVSKQALAEVNPKFRTGPNELEKEPELKILQPTNAEQLKQLTALVEALRRQKQGDQAWQNALRLWQSQIATGALSDQVKFQFVRRFYFWLLGRGTDDDVKRTFWGRGNAAVVNREVALYIEQFSGRRLDYALQLSLLAMRVPSTLNGYYLYFKYIVNGKLERAKDHMGGSWWELSNDDYLQDFEMFQQEFDGPNNEGNYKDVIKPAAKRSANQPPFDASRPYPASAAQNEQNKLLPKKNEDIIAGVLGQEHTIPQEALPDAMDTEEDGMVQKPVQAPPPNAQPVPVNLPAVGVVPNAQTDALIGEVRALREESERQRTEARQKEYRDVHKSLKRLTKEALASKVTSAHEEQVRLNGHLQQGLQPLREQLDRVELLSGTTANDLRAYTRTAERISSLMEQHLARYPALESNLKAAQEAELLKVRAAAAHTVREVLQNEAKEAFARLQPPPLPQLAPLRQEDTSASQVQQKVVQELMGANSHLSQQLADLAARSNQTLDSVSRVLEADKHATSRADQEELRRLQTHLVQRETEARDALVQQRQAQAELEAERAKLNEVLLAIDQVKPALAANKQAAVQAIAAAEQRGAQAAESVRQQALIALRSQQQQLVQAKEVALARKDAEAAQRVASAEAEAQRANDEAARLAQEATQWRFNVAALQEAYEKLQRDPLLRLPEPKVEPMMQLEQPPKQKEELNEPTPAAEVVENKRKRPAEAEAAPIVEQEKKQPKATEKDAAPSERKSLESAYNKMHRKMGPLMYQTYGLDLLPLDTKWSQEQLEEELGAMRTIINLVPISSLSKEEALAKFGIFREWRNRLPK